MYRTEKRNLKTMKIFLWGEGIFSYPGYFSWQSLSFASKDDIIYLCNMHRASLDKDWWQYSINEQLNISDDQIKWHSIKQAPKEFAETASAYVHFQRKNDAAFMKEFTEDIIQHKIVDENYDRVILVPRRSGEEWFAFYDSVMDTLVNKLRIANVEKKVLTAAMDLSSFSKYGNKECLHRNVLSYKSSISLMETVDIYTNAAPLCQQIGYNCYTKEEVLIAYDLVVKQIKHSNVLLKDAFGGYIQYF